MPFTVLVVIAAIAISLLRGGRLRRIADADLRRPSLLFLGVGVQLLPGILAGSVPAAAGTALLAASQGLVLAWVWCNRHLAGMGLVAVGLLLNASVILANGAMPVDPEAIAAIGGSGLPATPGRHAPLTPDTRLVLLADRWPLPPLRTVISAGDVVLAAGLIPLVHDLMTTRPAAERRGGHRTRTPATGEQPG